MVEPGIDLLLEEQRDLILGRRVGLVSNASAVRRDLTSVVDALRQTPGVRLAALFGPEHGFSAAVADAAHVASTTDPRTGLPVYSLYGQVSKPTPSMLAGLDVLLFDIPCVGARFYTYITTLLYVMQAAAENGMRVIICDRPNPIGGHIVEGPVLEPGFESFIGPGPLPIRYAMTVGELARLYNEAWGIGCDLIVVPCRGWRREMWFDETGLPWVPPSPAIPKLETAVVYPGTCLLEGTNLSEGRGTALPFEVVGAPWVDGWALSEALNALELPGVRFRPVQFEPFASKWAGQVCGGVMLHIVARESFRPVTVGLHLVAALRALYPHHFAWRLPHFDLLMGTDRVRRDLERGVAVDEIIAGWVPAQAEFAARRERFLLY